MATKVLTLRQLNRATLARQFLLTREKLAPRVIVERLVALQAQWPRPPFLTLWARSEGFERRALTELLLRRQLVRATFLRGTLHVLTSKDFVALRPTLEPMLSAGMRAILKARAASFDLEALLARARRLLGGQALTFEALRERFLKDDPKVDERAMGYAVRMQLPLVMVPEPDCDWSFPTQSRFTLASEWLGAAWPTGAAARTPAATGALVLRYLAGYGPASVADAQAWSGLRGLRPTFEALRPRLLSFEDEHGRELFDLEDAPRPEPDTAAPVRFLPDFDDAIVTRADERLVARAHRPKVFLSALRVAPTVLVDGFVAATWKLTRTSRKATLAVEPFKPFAAKVRAQVLAEGERLLQFAEPEAQNTDIALPK